jgi:DNA-binding CsgD family transcriptional regulator
VGRLLRWTDDEQPGTSTPTARQVEVLQLLADGLRSSEVAAALGISEATVRTHLRNVHRTLGVQTNAAAVGWAFRSGLVR